MGVEHVVERIGEGKRTARESELVVFTASIKLSTGINRFTVSGQSIRKDLIGRCAQRAVDEFHLGPVSNTDRFHRDQRLVGSLITINADHKVATVNRQRTDVDDGVVTLNPHFRAVIRDRNALLEVVRTGFDVGRDRIAEHGVRALFEEKAFNAGRFIGAIRFLAVNTRDELTTTEHQHAIGHLELTGFVEILVVVPTAVFEEEVLRVYRLGAAGKERLVGQRQVARHNELAVFVYVNEGTVVDSLTVAAVKRQVLDLQGRAVKDRLVVIVSKESEISVIFNRAARKMERLRREFPALHLQ